MANSKDISQRRKKFESLNGWGVRLVILVLFLSLLAVIIIQDYGVIGGHIPPNVLAEASLRNLKTELEEYYRDHRRYPQRGGELPPINRRPAEEFMIKDGVTVSFMTSDDKQRYVVIAFHKEGNRIYLTTSETSLFYWIKFSKQGLVPANPL